MPDHLTFERYYWFDRQVRAARYPNASSLARYFEICCKTAQRNIEQMRDRLLAPLEYDKRQKGYFYTDDSFALPPLQVTQEELLAILLARNLLAGSAGGLISEDINRFGRKLFLAMGRLGLTEDRMDYSFSATWNGYAPASGAVFRRVADALLKDRLLRFSYTSPKNGQCSQRLVEPHHLQHYMGSWVLIAFCRTRNDWRKFYLARMEQPAITDDTFQRQPRECWASQLEGGFGIFQQGELIPVVLRFSPFRARWIREQLWHPQQTMIDLADGGVELSFPVTDFREVKLKILQFGADVEVIAPAKLRSEISAELAGMVALYRDE